MTEPRDNDDRMPRMSEPKERRRIDFSDPAEVAYEFGEFRTALSVSQEHTRSALVNIGAAIQALQSDVRAIDRKVGEVTRLQIHQEQHSDGLQRAFDAIAKLTDTVERGFGSVREEQDRKRMEHAREIDHEIAQERGRLDKIRDRVIWMSGGAAAVSVIAGLTAGMVAYYTNRLEGYAAKERERTEILTEKTAERVQAIEYYLTRGGNTPDRVFVPSTK